ncbi:MAG: DUF1592 domain-containing protein [Myxococcota bacterium]
MERTSALGLLATLLLASSCTSGQIGDPSVPRASGGPTGPGPSPSASPTPTPSPTMSPPPVDPCQGAPVNVPYVALDRLNGAQILNTERAIFQQPSMTLALESGDTTSITQLEVEKLGTAAAALVETKGHDRYAPCDVDGAGSDSCADGFIHAFGEKAFRRPLSAEEVSLLSGVYQRTRALPDLSPPISFREAIDVVAQVILQSPQHLYKGAIGVNDASLPAGLKRTTGYERATRLSYALTNSTPDDQLLEAAKTGALDTVEGLKAAVRRLLDLPGGHAIVRHFGSSYAGINATVSLPALESLPKDSTRFPMDDPALRSAIRTETEALFEKVFYQSGDTFSALMTSNDAYVNGPLAQLYGVAGGPSDESTFAWVKLDPSQRAGIFTRAGFLAEFANQRYQSPIRRGVHLYRDTLCRTVPPPPPNVNTTPPAPSQDGSQALSVRAQTEHQTSATFCNSCHGQFNPLGFAFEHYDAMGAWQTTDTGTTANGSHFTVPVNADVTITVSDLAGTISGGVGFSEKLAESHEARDCMAKQWFKTMMGRAPAVEDTCTVSQLAKGFSTSSELMSLVVDVMTSAPALYVREE